MKTKIVLAVLVLVLVGGLAGCQAKTVTVEKVVEKEVTVPAKLVKPVVIDVVIEDIQCADLTQVGQNCAKTWAKQFMATHPGTTVNVTMLGDGTGSTGALDALIIAGFNPNVYQAYGGRVSAYRDMAAPLPYNPEMYVHPAVDSWVKDGKLTWYPSFAWAVGLYANYDLAVKLGVDGLLPNLDGDRTWTLAQFEAFAEAVKSKSTAQKPLYTAALFAKNGGGDYYLAMWMFAFNAKVYKVDATGNTDFTNLDVQSPQWVESLNWLKKGIDKGWFMPNPETLDFAAISAEVQAGRVVLGYTSATSYMADGISKQEWISYPNPTAKWVPFATGPTGIMVFDTGGRIEYAKSLANKTDAEIDAEATKTRRPVSELKSLRAWGKKVTDVQIAEAKLKDAAAIEFATWLDANYTQTQIDAGRHSWRTDLTPAWAKDSTGPVVGPTLAPTPAASQSRLTQTMRWQKGMIDKYGLTDIGTGSPYYTALREIMYKALGEFFAGKVDAEKCLSNIDTQFNEMVAKTK